MIMITPETFHGAAVSVEQNVSVSANGSKEVSLTPGNTRQLMISNPHLWWPNGYGNPDMYRIRIQFLIGSEISDDTSLWCGIRSVRSKTSTDEGWLSRDFIVNASRVHRVGGAW